MAIAKNDDIKFSFFLSIHIFLTVLVIFSSNKILIWNLKKKIFLNNKYYTAVNSDFFKNNFKGSVWDLNSIIQFPERYKFKMNDLK